MDNFEAVMVLALRSGEERVDHLCTLVAGQRHQPHGALGLYDPQLTCVVLSTLQGA